MHTNRKAPIEINANEFKGIAHELIQKIIDFNGSIEKKAVTKGETPQQIQELLKNHSFSEKGASASELMSITADLLFDHSLFNGHPKFMGYITASAAPIAALSDLLASSVNSNVGAYILSPIATEIEKQVVKWLSEFIGVSSNYGGILVSGGNMANFTAFLAARNAHAPEDFKENGFSNSSQKLMIYCSKTTHTWIEKAAILFGHGSNSIRWISADVNNKMDIDALEVAVKNDLEIGHQPFMVVGTAGDVSTGAVDNLAEIASICRSHRLWFHVDGAYGVPAAIIPEMKTIFEGLKDADSIALDPHKWLYSSLEAGCTLVKNPQHLVDAYGSHPEYYNFSVENFEQNYYEYGLQNSRGFKALKVWVMLQQVGRSGYIEMINDDIQLSKLMFEMASNNTHLEAVTQNLSITTFRYVPPNMNHEIEINKSYLNELNETINNNLQRGGKMFLSHAIINDIYCLRSCIVNFRTSKKDIEEIIDLVVEEGEKVHKE